MLRISYPLWSRATETNRPSRNAFHVQLSAKNSSRKMNSVRRRERERGLDRHTSLLTFVLYDRVNKRV